MKHLIILDDLRNNARSAKFLHKELEDELRVSLQADIVCAPSPVEEWTSKESIEDLNSLKTYLQVLSDPIMLIDWEMPVPAYLNDGCMSATGLKKDGLYLFYLIKKHVELKNCFLWSQFGFNDAETYIQKNYATIDENFLSIAKKSWLPKATTSGRILAAKLNNTGEIDAV